MSLLQAKVNCNLRVKPKQSVVVCLLLVLCVAASGAAEPAPVGYINDFAGVIDPATRAALERYCAQVEERTGAQIAVLTIASLEGRPIEDVANEIFQRWGIGKKGSDEGVLLLLSIGDRRMRLEVGYGLEPILPDGFSGSILRAMRPALRENRYGEAVREAVRTVGARIAQAKGVSLDAPLPPTPVGRRRPVADALPLGIFALVALMILLAGIGSRRRYSRYGYRGSGAADVLTGMLIGSLLGRGFGSGRSGGGFGGFGGGGGFGGFGGGSSGGGGASSSW